MARPTALTIVSGEESWDADVQSNFDLIFDGPLPVFRHGSGGAVTLAAFTSAVDPADYDQCFAMLNETTRGWIPVYSDGTSWIIIGQPSLVTTLTDATTVAVNATTIGHSGTARVTLAGNRTLGNPTGGYDGQVITIEVIQDGTGSRTLAYDSKYRFSTDLPSPTLTTTASAKDVLMFKYHLSADKWDLLAINKGF